MAGNESQDRDTVAANPIGNVGYEYKRVEPNLMPPSPIFGFTESAVVVEVGTRVVHLGRLDVGEGRITKIYPDGYCDAEFAGGTFSWLLTNHFCAVEDFQRRRLQQEEQASIALEKARAREAQVIREKAAIQGLAKKVRSGRRLTDQERVLVHGLSARDQLGIFTYAKPFELFIQDIVPLLHKASEDVSLSDALDGFWKARVPTAECRQLMPLAPRWWKERLWRVVRYSNLPLGGKLNVLSANELQLNDGLRRELIEELVEKYAAGDSFEQALVKASTRVQFEVLVTIDRDLLPRFQECALQLLRNADVTSPSALLAGMIGEFWTKHEASILRGSQLFVLAPLHVQRRILRRHFLEYRLLLDRLFDNNAERSGDWPAAVVYGELDDADKRLSELWCSDPNSSHEIARMLSARAAEKVAAWFYAHLGFKTVDVAIHQLSGESSAWKTHDLQLNGLESLDVKNARMPVNNKAFYVEHTVPRFKRDRNSRDVTIVGVVSPYLSLNFILDPDRVPFEVSDVRYLGEAKLNAISQLCEMFSSSAITVQDPANGAFLPPWYFDFPSAWYRDFENVCANLRKAELPDEDEMRILYNSNVHTFPIAKYLAARLELPNWLLEGMAPWVRTFVSQLQRACRPQPRLAQLFLLLLTDFLGKLQEDYVESFEPAAYLRLLFDRDSLSVSPSRRRPLGIEDPLDTVRTLCVSLQQLWIAREYLELNKYTQYRLSGGGILQGRVRQGLSWETILSYCGGRIEGKGRCGCAPLILGVESPCPACRKLVCRHCGYCSESCMSLSAQIGQ